MFFNVFIEHKIEKELASNFDDWNDLYNEELDKYVSYIVDFRWFKIWKKYVFSHYGIKVNSGIKNPNTLKTLKSFKTKKSFKTIQSIKS